MMNSVDALREADPLDAALFGTLAAEQSIPWIVLSMTGCDWQPGEARLDEAQDDRSLRRFGDRRLCVLPGWGRSRAAGRRFLRL